MLYTHCPKFFIAPDTLQSVETFRYGKLIEKPCCFVDMHSVCLLFVCYGKKMFTQYSRSTSCLLVSKLSVSCLATTTYGLQSFAPLNPETLIAGELFKFSAFLSCLT